MTTNAEKITGLADELTGLAEFLRANADTVPEDIHAYTGTGGPLQVLQFLCDDAVELATVAHWFGGARDKRAERDTFRVERRFGENVAVEAWAFRNRICEQVQVGTETVEVPDETADEALARVAALEAELAAARDAVPTVTVERPVMGWSCEPILSAAAQ